MADGGSKVESSIVSSQDIGSKNKRKLFDPSIKNLINLPSSLTEFPWYEQSLKKFQSPSSDPMSSGIRFSWSKEVARGEEFESADWDDPIVCALEELLSAGLLVLFRDAIMQIVERGYTEEDAEKSVSRHGLYCGGNDLVSNVVDDALAFLKKGKGVCASRDEVFEDLKQLVDYTMLEMINVLREVKPSLSIAEAMWWLLMCDLNISQACTAEGDLLNFLDGKEVSGENSSCSTPSQPRSEAQSSVIAPPNTKDSNIPRPSNSNAQSCPTETLNFGSFPNLPNPRNKGRDHLVMVAQSVGKSLSSFGDRVQNMSLTLSSEERSGTGRKGRPKKELVTLRQKSLHGHNEKAYKVYGKGSFKSGKVATIGGFVVEKRMKPPTDLPPVQSKSGASKNSAETGVLAFSADGNHCVSTNTPLAFPAPDNSSTIPSKCTISALPAPNIEHVASSSSENYPSTRSESCAMSPVMPDFYTGIPFDKSLGKYVPQDDKDELLLKLVPRVQELENELNSWTEWANQKVMQAARRLSKDQPELKALRLEKQEADQCKKEKQMLEENTMKRLSEMEFALNNATGQVERSNTTVRRLELEHVLLKREMEAAKARAVESATNCLEALEREQKALKDAQSREGQKALLREELEGEKSKSAELQQELSKTRNRQKQVEARLKEERVAKEKLHAQAASIRKEREQLEAAAKAEEEMMKQKAEEEVKKYMVDIKKLEGQISLLKYKSDSSKIAALRGSVDGGFGCFLPGSKSANPTMMGNQIPSFSRGGKNFPENVASGHLKQERECVMCLAEEKSVFFLPCAHQVLCPKCNELHEKECMKDCPSCRTLIQRRISVRFARS